MENRYIAELRFYFEEEIGVVKSITNLVPEKEWVKGERTHGNTGAICDKNGFSIRSELSQNRPLEDHIGILVQKIKSSLLLSKSDLFKGNIELKLVIYTDRPSDGFHLGKDQLSLLAKIGAEIDMEFYSL